MSSLPPSWEDRLIAIPECGCWVWLGELNRNGYGRVSVRGRKMMVHREVYERLVGPIPEGLVLDHKCRVRCCANPYHLEPVTVQVNTHRGEAVLMCGRTRLTKEMRDAATTA